MTAPPGDKEHIIPQCVGGRLSAHILCRECNSTLGAKLVSPIKQEPAIQSAVRALSGKLPAALVRDYRKQLTFVGRGRDGSVIRAKPHKGGVKILQGPGSHGSYIIDSGQAMKHIEETLGKIGLAPDIIAEYQRKYTELPVGESLTLPTKKIMVKQPGPPLQVEISGTILDNRLSALIAYEFLALCIGDAIYHQNFDAVRSYILTGKPELAVSVVQYRAESGPDPIHVIRIDKETADTVVEIRFFRWIVSRVTFGALGYGGPDIVYMEDLESRETRMASSWDDAKNGKWYVYDRS